jgi:CDP-paratose 2-epimerase
MNILITGGAGFIGAHAAAAFASQGHRVTVFDNLSRHGTSVNLRWLRRHRTLTAVIADIRDDGALTALVKGMRYDVVLHLAAQVAVTMSVRQPRDDFDVNLRGTLTLLEAIRLHSPATALLYASTNKVYGALEHHPIAEHDTRYVLGDAEGVDDGERLQFHSPYGCSKGAAEQYALDYARIYGLRVATFRQSCIYGERQFGVEDQGWVAWFAIAHYFGDPMTVYGSGKQVRDLLWIDDLVSLYALAIANIDAISGTAFNVGGGPANALSVMELLDWLGSRSGRPVAAASGPARPGDQRVFVSANRLVREQLGWSPSVSVDDGLERLWQWIESHRTLLDSVRSGRPRP